MTNEPSFKMRATAYRRKRDGARVVAADWPDGDVSWRLEPMPVITPSGCKVVGTCCKATFDKGHEEIA